MANHAAAIDTLDRITLRSMIEKKRKEECFELLYSDGRDMIEAVTVDQTNAIELLDLPISVWFGPDSSDFPKIAVSIRKED